MPHLPTCPACQKPVAPRAANKAYPFCSLRCRQVDLGRWLGEEYRVPDRPMELEDQPVAPRADADDEEDGEPHAHA